MKAALVAFLVATAAVPFALVACGAKAPEGPSSPLGGPVNTGGKPDVDKSKGDVDVGGPVNTGGKPDVDKSKGDVGVGGPVNTGGKPDVDKSLKGVPGGKDAGAK